MIEVTGLGDDITVVEIGDVGGPPGPQGPTGADSTVPGPQGPTGPVGPPGIVMSADPPPTTEVLWADTDEEAIAGEGGGGVSDVFAQYTSIFVGVSAAKGTTIQISFTNPAHGTATALPEGWVYSADGTLVGCPPGVYSFSLNWEAPDQYWSGKVTGAHQLGTNANSVQINPGAPVLNSVTSTWFATTSGVAALHNTTGNTNPSLPGWTGSWFSVAMTHAAAAAGTNAATWALNVVRLGDIP